MMSARSDLYVIVRTLSVGKECLCEIWRIRGNGGRTEGPAFDKSQNLNQIEEYQLDYEAFAQDERKV